ncbi:MAG: hypothetical protein ACFB6S_13125 [Geminicoccaceae bacterium]
MSSSATLNVGVFLVAFTTLLVELILIRVFDVILFPNIAYMVITCALFAFGMSGVLLAFHRHRDPERTKHRLIWLCLAYALAILAITPLLNANPFQAELVPEEPFAQFSFFVVMYLTIAVPFFLGGLILALIFSTYPGRIRTLYFYDLVGAALGAVCVIPFIPFFGAPGLLILSGALAVLAAAVFSGRGLAINAAAGGTVAALILVSLPPPGSLDFRVHVNKRDVLAAQELGKIEFSRWDPVSKIDVTAIPEMQYLLIDGKHVAYDGGSQSTYLIPFDGEFTDLRATLDADKRDHARHMWGRLVAVSHAFKAANDGEDRERQVLVIGAGGGQETKAALVYGAAHVDAVEMVGTVVDITGGHYSDYIGDVFGDARVDHVHGEGRAFLRAHDKRYDIIQIFSNHTSSSMAAGSGAVSATFLQTVEAYEEYFSSLADNGILHVNHHVFPRMVTTAAAAWAKLGRGSFERHVLIYQRCCHADNIPTMLVKMSPWTAEEIRWIDGFMLPAGHNQYDTHMAVQSPLPEAPRFLDPGFFEAPLAPALQDLTPFNVAPATDDQPFFNFVRTEFDLLEPAPERFLDPGTRHLLNEQMKHLKVLPMDVVHLVVTGVAAIILGVGFVLLPLLFSRAGRTPWAGKGAAIGYHACLGAGFIIVEIVLIHIFMRLVGFPLYAYSTVICTMLLAAGLGSLSAESWGIDPRNRWTLPFVGIFIVALTLWFVQPPLTEALLAEPMPVRIAATALMCFPLGFFMGMPLPLGILALANKPTGAVAWAWGMNGLFTVVGGLLAMVLALWFGFKLALVAGYAFYLLAFILYAQLRRHAEQKRPAPSSGDAIAYSAGAG